MTGMCFQNFLRFFFAHFGKNHAMMFAPMLSIRNAYQIIASMFIILIVIV